MLRHLLETLLLSFYRKKSNTNSIGQLRTFYILLHLQSNFFYPSSTFYKFLIEGPVDKVFFWQSKDNLWIVVGKTQKVQNQNT
jgi:hypothetical protein